ADKLLGKAEALSHAQDWEQAIVLYGRVIGIDPRQVEALYFRGSSYLDRQAPGDAALALADFAALQKMEPDYVMVHYKKALALEKLGRLDEAKAEKTQAVRLDPGLVFQDPGFQKAQALSSKGEYKKALPLYRKMVFDYPACVPLLIDTANTMVECG